MAHVIKPPQEEDYKRVKCDNCRSLIGYLPVEVQKYSGRDISGGPDGREWVVCPHCGDDITLRSW